MKDEDVEYLKNSQTINVKDGDVVVINCNKPVSIEGCKMIKDHVKDFFPNNKCMVLVDGMEIGVMREATNEQ
jgi:ribosomal protein L24